MVLPNKVKVFIVDDSAVVRQVLQALLLRDPIIEVLGTAPDPLFALQRMQQGGWPDVLVLDVEMPRMDGITFLKKLMIEHPLPVVICSTLTEKGAQVTLDALAAGAVSVVTKPWVGLKDFLMEQAIELTQTIKAAARANTSNLHSAPRTTAATNGTQTPMPIPAIHFLRETTEKSSLWACPPAALWRWKGC